MKAATISAIEKYLELNAKWKNSYFWSNFGNSARRSHIESLNTLDYIDNDDGIELHFHVTLSRSNAYLNKEIRINGVKKTATALKKYIK